MGSSAEPGGHSETAGLLLCLTAHQTGWEGWGPARWSGVWRVLQIDFGGAWGWGEAGMSGPGPGAGGREELHLLPRPGAHLLGGLFPGCRPWRGPAPASSPPLMVGDGADQALGS